MYTKATNSLSTLRGVFEQPNMHHRRDFLRENKLSLRELQKNTSQKLTQQKQEHENKQYKHIPKFSKTHDETISRTLGPQCRNNEPNSKRQSRVAIRNVDRCSVVPRGGGDADAAMRSKPNNLGCRRAYSQQRHEKDNSKTTHTCCCTQQHQKIQRADTQYQERVPKSGSSISVRSKAESCDKEVQTEDIHDEHYLYEALRKCSSSEVNVQNKQKPHNILTTRASNSQHAYVNYNSQQYEPELNTIHPREGGTYVSHCQYEDNNSQHEQIIESTPRLYHKEGEEVENYLSEDLNQNFRNLKLTTDMRGEAEFHPSARSRQTLCSTSTKRNAHKLGSREDIRLPRYLEREKREKEEERIRVLNKDQNCPLGHYALSEEERVKGLNKAQKKMSSLINELNHMPMTVETLRIRKRKVEIEKELSQIEFDIRLYSKPMVYLPQTDVPY